MTNNKLRPYEKVINSGIEWIGTIPEHWNCVKLSTRFRERRSKVSDKDFMPLSVTKHGIVPQLATAAKSNDGDNRKLVKKGDFVINSRSDRKGSSGLSSHDGSVSLINIVLEPNQINSKFAHYLFKSNSFVEEYYRNGRGIVADLWTTRFYEMRNIYLPVPTDFEQDQIVKYLDHQLVKINKFIKAKKKLIAVLKEQKQAIINEAVTKGLDPNVKMKLSGIEWLGDVPEDWEIMYCKRLLTLLTDYTANGSFGDLAKNVTYLDDGFARLIRLTDLRVGLANKGVYVSEHSYNYLAKSALHGGEFLIANVGAYAGYSCIMPSIEYPCTLGPNMMMAKFKNNSIMTEFSSIVFNSDYIQTQLKIKANNTAAQPKINKDDFKNVKIAIPSIDEQISILNWIKMKSAILDKSIKRLEDEISLISEYKNSLISDVVTGKVDIRNIVIAEFEEENIDDTELEEDSIYEESFGAEDGDE